MDKVATEKVGFKNSIWDLNLEINEGGDDDMELEMREEQYTNKMSKMKNDYKAPISFEPNIKEGGDGNAVSFDSTDPLRNIEKNKTARQSAPNISLGLFKTQDNQG